MCVIFCIIRITKWRLQNQNELYTYEEFVFVTEASTVQQNDSDRTKNKDNKKNNEKANKE